ncbi:hypothetical protein ACQY0O_004027 [Thecaphora frezii]
MGRGRRPNLSLEPTRSLQTQRAFRQRKAEHLANLEESVKRLTEENGRLRRLLHLDRCQPLPEHAAAATATATDVSTAVPTPPALTPCPDQAKGQGAHAASNAEHRCPKCAELQATKERLSLAASHVEKQMTALNQALASLRSVLTADRLAPMQTQRAATGSQDPVIAAAPEEWRGASMPSTDLSLGHSPVHEQRRWDPAYAVWMAKRPKLLHEAAVLPSPTLTSASASASTSSSDYTAVQGVQMASPFYSRGAGASPTHSLQSPDAPVLSRHLPLPFHPAQGPKASRRWHSAATPPGFASSPPSEVPAAPMLPPYPQSGPHHLPASAHAHSRPATTAKASASLAAPVPPPPMSSASPATRSHTIEEEAARFMYRATSTTASNDATAPPLHSPYVSASAPYELHVAASPGRHGSVDPVRSASYGPPMYARSSVNPVLVSHATSRVLPAIVANPAHRDDHSYRPYHHLDGRQQLAGDATGSAERSPWRALDAPNTAGGASSDCYPKPPRLAQQPGTASPSLDARLSTAATAAAATVGVRCGGPPSRQAGERTATSAGCCGTKPTASAGEATMAADGEDKPMVKEERSGRERVPEGLRSPPPLGVVVDMRMAGDENKPCCFGLIECDAKGRIVL